MRRVRCELCNLRIAVGICRRCNKKICERCHFHHGLCIRCRNEIRYQ